MILPQDLKEEKLARCERKRRFVLERVWKGNGERFLVLRWDCSWT